MGIDLIYDYEDEDDVFNNFTYSIKELTESFNNLKPLIDEAKNQIQKERTDFVSQFLEKK